MVNFPTEIFFHIFSFLQFTKSLLLANKTWKIIYEEFLKIYPVTCYLKDNVVPIKRIEVNSLSIMSNSIQSFDNEFSGIRELFIYHCINLVSLNLPRLRKLTVANCNKLTTLTINSTTLVKLSIAHCKSLTTLPACISKLYIDNCCEIRDISYLTNLVKLRIYHNESITKLPVGLRELELYGLNGKVDMSGFTSLKKLSMIDSSGWITTYPENIEELYLENYMCFILPDLPKLAHICLNRCKDVANILAKVPSKLTSLELIACNIDNIPIIESLKELRISECHLISNIEITTLMKLYITDCVNITRRPDVSDQCEVIVENYIPTWITRLGIISRWMRDFEISQSCEIWNNSRRKRASGSVRSTGLRIISRNARLFGRCRNI